MKLTPALEAQAPYSMRVNTVWCDKTGKIGLIIGETEDGFLIQTAERMIELIPIRDKIIFENSVEYLGEI